MIGWKADFRRDNQVEVAFDLVSAAGARALGIVDYGIAAGGAANLFTIAASCVAEAVAAHPSRKLVLCRKGVDPVASRLPQASRLAVRLLHARHVDHRACPLDR